MIGKVRNPSGRFSIILTILFLLFLLLNLNTCVTRDRINKEVPEATAQIRLVDADGTPVREIELASNLQASLSGLQPSTTYDIVLESDEKALVSWARLTTDLRGSISPFVIWYQTGIIGCTRGTESLEGPFWFRSFEDAQKALAGKAFQLSVRDLEGKEISSVKVPVATRIGERPTIFAGTKAGCLLNSVIEGKEDVYAVGKNFPAGSIVQIYLVRAQRLWKLREPLRDIRGPNRSSSVLTVRLAPDQTDFIVLVWSASETQLGSYDFITRHYLPGEDHIEWDFLEAGDMVTYRSTSGFVVQQLWGMDPHLSEDIAGRKIYRSPWFEYVDGFAKGQDVWGAIDPKKKSTSNPYTYAAWYVVDHKATWADGDSLVDVTGGAEVTPIQPGCINGNWTRLWQNPSPPGLGPTSPSKSYDVVIDFGNFTPGSVITAPGTYTIDVDFIDRVDMEGFFVIDDPTALGSHPIGTVDMNLGCDYALNKTVNWTNNFVTTPVSISLLDPQTAYEPCNNPSDPLYNANQTARILARIKYPKDSLSTQVASGGPFPLVLFIHGQQGFGVEGWKGYDYLLDLLASHGFIAMSIDSNDFLDASMASRGELVREYLRRMRDHNAPGGSSINGVSFIGKIDLSKSVIAGHSRGGEAVAAAYELQRVSPDTGYGIGGVIAIAPMQAIGRWTSEPEIILRLRDVPYLIIHGARDGDVHDFQGLRTYDRADPFEAPSNSSRQMVYIKDANHDFFNEKWITSTGESAYSGDRDPSTLAPQQQQAAAKIYIRAFVEAYIHGKKEYLNYFTGVIPPSVSPPISVVTSYHPAAPDRLVIDHHEESDQSLRSAAQNTMGGLVTPTSLDLPQTTTFPGLNFDEYQLRAFVPLEKLRISSDPAYVDPDSTPPDKSDTTVTINNTFPHSTHGAVLGWNAGSDSYSTEIPANQRTLVPNYTHLSFRVGQVYRATDNQNPAGLDQDFALQVTDSDNDSSAQIWISSYTSLPYPYQSNYHGWSDPKSVMRTVRIPLAAFTVNSSQVDLNKLQKITFFFNRTAKGEICLDDIEFVK